MIVIALHPNRVSCVQRKIQYQELVWRRKNDIRSSLPPTGNSASHNHAFTFIESVSNTKKVKKEEFSNLGDSCMNNRRQEF